MNSLTPLPPQDLGYPAFNPPDDPAPAGSKFQWLKFLTSLRKFWWIPLITLTLGGVAGVAHFFLAAPVFISTARMWETEKMRLPDGAAFSEDSQNYFGTQSELLRSERMRLMTLEQLEKTRPAVITRGSDRQPLAVNIRVIPAPKSTIFTIEASSRNPAYTPAYLDALMLVYRDYKKTVRVEVSGDMLNSIARQVLDLNTNLLADQAALTEFQRTNSNWGGVEQEVTVASAHLAKLETQLSDLQLEDRLLDAALLEHDSSLSRITNSVGVSLDSLRGAESTSASSSESRSASREIELLKLQREKLSQHLRPLHPRMVKLDKEIERAQRLIDLYRQQNEEQVANARQALKIKIAGVEASIKEWKDKVVTFNSRLAVVASLKENVSWKKTFYDRMLTMLENVKIGRNIDQDTITVLDNASPAKRSYKEAQSTLGLAIFGGLAAGFGIIFLITIRDDRFNSLAEVNEKMGGIVVGQVPEIPLLKSGAPLALLQDNDDRHIFAESYRSLRSAILFLAVEGERPKVLLITSAVPNEGKSTVTTNLARALAMGGSRVLLVDGDMRKGHLHDLLGMQSKPGLAELLRQPDDPYQFIQTNALANFSFLARGSVLTNPGDVFLNSTFVKVLERLRKDFDYILIDSSPVFAADDATTMAPKVDGTLFVVRSRFSRARIVREALDLLAARQARVLGLVLNRADASARGYYYYNYSDYYTPATTALGTKG